MMIVNFELVEQGIAKDVKELSDPKSPLADKLLRTIAQGLYVQMETRVFNESGAVKTDGSKIGKYKSKAYVKKRAKEYGRTNMDVNLMLTDQMHSAFSFGVSPSGSYNIGFLNDLAANKSRWNEDRFGTIFQLTAQERESVYEITSEFINKELGGRI
jgi:hypothetical protein